MMRFFAPLRKLFRKSIHNGPFFCPFDAFFFTLEVGSNRTFRPETWLMCCTYKQSIVFEEHIIMQII